MEAVPKKYRDLAMRAFLNFERDRRPEQHKSPGYLYYAGLPRDVDANRVVEVLEVMGYLETEQDGEYISVRVSDAGKTYFENQADHDAEKTELRKIADASQKQAGAAIREAQAAKETAKSTRQIAESAKQTAEKADVKGWIAVLISAVAMLIELAANWRAVVELLRNLAGRLLK